MTIDLNWIAAILGCAALLVFWMWKRASGVRGLLFVLLGDIMIIGAVLLYEQNAAALPTLLGVTVGLCVLTLLVLSLRKISYIRRHHGPHYQAPDEMTGRCSACARPALLKRYPQGWLCPMCTRHQAARAA